MKNKKFLRPILLATLAALIIIQFFGIDKNNPPIDVSQDFIQNTNPPTAVANLLKTACYDCHSHTTKYPWYTNVQPFAWWIKGHVDNGSKHLNFSKWAAYEPKKQAHKLEEMVEMVEGKEMPMLSYMIGHPDAWIDADQRKLIVDWAKSIQ